MSLIYHYVDPNKPQNIQSTESIDDLILLLYEGKAKLLDQKQIKRLNLGDDYNNQIRIAVSSSKTRVPLYDIYSNHVFLIFWENVYDRILNNNYRFIDPKFISDLKSKENLTSDDLFNLQFLSNYDLETLRRTYFEIFYESFVTHSYATNCRRPSFSSGLVHINPYYTMNELNFLAYDWDLTKEITIDPIELENLCKQIQKYDIPSQVLIDHQLFIYQTKSIGLVKHYSLYGSYYMNQYLRQTFCCINSPNAETTKEDNDFDIIRNIYLEGQILVMIRRIKSAPAFTQPHTVYRFVSDDSYLHNLRPGDIYQDPSFTSTTRNPFYYKEKYSFGYVLIKIRLPGNVKGVGLCIESYSNFPKEEEIILPPTSRYRLDSIVETPSNTQFHRDLNLQVQKRYEFTWIGDDYEKDTDIPDKFNISGFIPKIKTVTFQDILDDDNYKYVPMSERLLYFRDNYANMNNQFESLVGKTSFIFSLESYNSTTVYKPFFYYETTDGIMITTANPIYGNINLLIEIDYEIHINYYFRYSITDPSAVIDLNRPEWIEWLAILTYAVGSRSVIIHPNYMLQTYRDDTIEEKIYKTRHTFSQNIYLYMKHGTKMFEYAEITPQFDYFQLDYLKKVKLDDIINVADKNELYRIAQSSKIDNVYDFYLYIVENYPQWIKTLEDQIGRIFEAENNPFINIAYKFDSWQYLYERNLVKQIPPDREFIVRPGSHKRLIGDRQIPQFKNRLRSLAQKPNY